MGKRTTEIYSEAERIRTVVGANGVINTASDTFENIEMHLF